MFEFRKPEGVRRAQLSGNTEALSAMGRKGAARRAELKKTRFQEHLADELPERLAELAQTEGSKDGDVLPPEPQEKNE